MATIKVERKAHTRKAFLKKDGTRVKSAEVDSSSYRMQDRGQPGRTPKEDRFFEPQVQTGWNKKQPESERRVRVLEAHGGNELASARAMQALANVTTDRETKRMAKSDADYFYRLNRQIKQLPRRRSNHHKKTLRITPRQPRLRR